MDEYGGTYMKKMKQLVIQMCRFPLLTSLSSLLFGCVVFETHVIKLGASSFFFSFFFSFIMMCCFTL